MQKKLIALALAGGMLAPLAAQAQNVQIFGTLRPSLDFIDNGDENGQFMEANASELGFKGTEDLGGGLKVVWQLVSALAFDERGDGTRWMNRDSWVGLAGSFGSLTIGNHNSAYQQSSAWLDPFSFTIGDYNNIMGIHATGGNDFNSRFKNSIMYKSPVFSGVQISASYALKTEGFNDHQDDDTYGVAAKWTSGAFGAVIGYEKQKTFAGNDASAWKIGGSFKVLPTTTLYAMVDRIDSDAASDARTAYYIAGKHSIGNIDLMANFMVARDSDGATPATDDDGAKAFSLGAVYNFSKRTNIGAYYAQVKNDDDGVYGMDSGYSPAAGEDKVKGFSIRMQHKF